MNIQFDRFRFVIPVTLVFLLAIIGITALFFGDILPSRLAEDIPVPPRIVELVVGGLLVTVGFVYLRQPESTGSAVSSLISAETPPERPKRPPQLVGETFDTAVEEALREVRLKDVEYSSTAPQQTLSETVHRILSARGYNESEIEEQLSSGDWTGDPVAKGFLSDSVEYPVWFTLLRWAQPSYAYQQGITRTTVAIQGLVDDRITDSTSQSDWFSEFRDEVERYLDTESGSDESSSHNSETLVTDQLEEKQ